MAKAGAGDVRALLIGGRNVLADVTDLTGPDIEHVTEETTPIGVSEPTHAYVGLNKGAMGFSGFYDSTEGAMVDVVMNDINDAFAVACLPILDRFTGFAGLCASRFVRKPVKNELSKADGSFTVRGHVEEGHVLEQLTAHTADWDTESAPVDNAASSAAGGAAYVQVAGLELDGHDELVVTVRHSANGSVWADLVDVTFDADGYSAQRVAVAGTVNRYLAVSAVFTGTGTAPAATVFTGFARA